LYLGNSLDIMPSLRADHVICDPPYEESLHKSKNSLRGRVRVDSGPDLQRLDFDSIDSIRDQVVKICSDITEGWFIAFCTIEGVAKWADSINESSMKYK
jgi:site-specific DNA-methyltransferase (adenine-specific)